MDLIENNSKIGDSVSVPSSAPPAREAGEEEPRPRPAVDKEWLPWSFPVFLFAGVAILLFVYLGQFACLVQTQYRIVALRDTQRNLEREKIDLQLQIQQLTSLERVERVASGRLKMMPPARRQVVDLSPSRIGAASSSLRKNSTQAK